MENFDRTNDQDQEGQPQENLLEGVGFKKHSHDEGDACDDFTENENNPFESSSCNKLPRPWSRNTRWRVAGCLKVLFDQVKSLAPERNRTSDGTIGDLAHQARDSDHNPWVMDQGGSSGIVTAVDITHDPTKGCDCNVLAKSLQEARDKRIKYVIWNKQIMSSTVSPWTWRQYKGSNPHTKHLHVSVNCERSVCDSTDNWNIRVK
jgi:hypothetical protein